MHIAICDDNIADRKQTERLLKRESDRRSSSTGVLYIDSYGQKNSLLHAPMLYDMFFIDMAQTAPDAGLEIVNALCAAGVSAPIVMLISSVNYHEYSFPENVLFMDKPILVADLSKIIEYGLCQKAKSIPKIELRGDTEGYYVTEDEIICVTLFGQLYSNVQLTDGRCIRILCTPENFLAQVERFQSFAMPNYKTVINKKYVKKLSFSHVQLTNNMSFRIHLDCRKALKSILSQ